MVGRREIEERIGTLGDPPAAERGQAQLSPGMAPRHYSPVTPLVVVRGQLPEKGRGAYLWWSQPLDAARQVRMPGDAPSYAALLYQLLHAADGEAWDWIAVEAPPDSEAWAAIHDRLRRAATRVG
jgi:L-threonylcarbamoyladenylate synthase